MTEENKKPIEEKKAGQKEADLKVEDKEKKEEGVVSEVKPKKDAKQEPPKKKKKKIKRQVLKGRATVKCSYNNTMVSIADLGGNVLGWASSGLLGFKGAKKATPYAASQVVANVSEKVKKYGVKELEVFVRGVGSGRESSVRALVANGFELTLIKDTTPIPHNGCRPKRPRRI